MPLSSTTVVSHRFGRAQSGVMTKQSTARFRRCGYATPLSGQLGALRLGRDSAALVEFLTWSCRRAQKCRTARSLVPREDPLSTDAPNTREAMNSQIRSSLQRNLGVVRKDWQSAYTAPDQAISDAEIVSSKMVIDLARALRDKYRDEYQESVVSEKAGVIPKRS